MNIVEFLRRMFIGLLAMSVTVLLSANVVASSDQGNGAEYPSIAVNLSTGPSIAVFGEGAPRSAERKVAAYLPIIQQSGDPATRSRYDFVAQRMLQLVNEERQRAGCDPVAVNDKLTRAAQTHSQDMAEHEFMDHQGTDGSWPHERVLREGYNFGYVGETIARSTVHTADAVFAQWMNSPGHDEIILNCMAQDIGIGYSIPYWTLVLAKQL